MDSLGPTPGRAADVINVSKRRLAAIKTDRNIDRIIDLQL
jgi:hypothetical protein